MREITPREFVSLAASGADPFLLDVREGWELALAAAPGAVHIPMGEIPGRLAEIPADRDIVVMCKAGARSMNVARYLHAQGYTRVANLTGGILAWSAEIDPSIATY
jgi:rhodanese-related sulfurtransferase